MRAARTMSVLQRGAKGDPRLAARVALFLYRVPEEFCDVENDPDALCNLIDDPGYSDERDRLRGALEAWMEETGDRALHAFRHRDSQAARDRLMESMSRELGPESVKF